MTPIGNGNFGTVYKASDVAGMQGNIIYAIKKIDNNKIDTAATLNEIEIMQKIKKTFNLLECSDYMVDDRYTYIVMPFCPSGPLSKLIVNHGIANEIEAIEYFRQICYGLNELHNMGILHRDLKTENILLVQNTDTSYPFSYVLFICDFGLSFKKQLNSEFTQYIGTPLTNAPEVYESGNYTNKIDIYSLGCILYKMLVGKELFDGANDTDVLNNKKNMTTAEIRPCFKDTTLSKITLELLEGCLQYDPNQRITMSYIDELIKYSTIYTNYTPFIIKPEDIETQCTINLKKYVRSKKRDEKLHNILINSVTKIILSNNATQKNAHLKAVSDKEDQIQQLTKEVSAQHLQIQKLTDEAYQINKAMYDKDCQIQKLTEQIESLRQSIAAENNKAKTSQPMTKIVTKIIEAYNKLPETKKSNEITNIIKSYNIDAIQSNAILLEIIMNYVLFTNNKS